MLIAILPVLLTSLTPLLWTLIAYTVPHSPPDEWANTNITVAIAHPDDEVMFFGPTMNRLSHPHNNNTVSIVCFSAGNAEGLGEVRKLEMAKSAEHLQVLSEHLTIFDDEKLPDSMDVDWDVQYLAELLENTVKTDKLVTFDRKGISDHPNHKCLHDAAKLWKSQSSSRRVWTLTTVPIYRKYIANIDSLISYFVERQLLQTHSENEILVIAQQAEYQRTKRIMSADHRSQMKWFRYLWIVFSRYMYVNNLVEL